MNKKQRFVLVLLAVGNLAILATFIWLTLANRVGQGVSPASQPAPSSIVSATLLAHPTVLLDVFPTATLPRLATVNPAVSSLEPSLGGSPVPVLDCVSTISGGLATEIYTLVQQMPGPDSNGMVIPSEAQMQAWENLILAVAVGDTVRACRLIWDNGFPYQLVRFEDVRNASQVYWLLRENLPVTVGWGTYVIRSEGVTAEVVIEVPHPVADWRTDPEGVDVFRRLGARALLVAGTHRCANTTFSSCNGQTVACGMLEPYRTSDIAHAPQSMFQAAHRALVPCGGGAVAIQLHANSLAGCPDLFIGNGTLHPGEISRSFYANVLASCRDYAVDLADDSQAECAYNGGDNLQGLYNNGCGLLATPAPCPAYSPYPNSPEQFIFLEQSTAVRQDYACLLEALHETFP